VSNFPNQAVAFLEGNPVEMVSLLTDAATPANSPKVINGSERKQIILCDPLTGVPLDLQGGGGGGGNVATDNIWQAAGDLVVGTGFHTATRLPKGSPLSYVRVNAGGTALEYGTPAGGGDALVANPLSQFASTTSAQLAGVVSDETGSGSLVFATSPTLVTPALGTPSSATLTNATGLPVGTGISGLAAGVATFLATPSSANLIAAVTNETGTGSLVFATSPTLVTPVLGTPTSVTLTNATGLPVSTGISGLGTGAATFLATPSSANLAAMLTDETGTGANVFATSPTLVTPVLGTPTSVTLTNATGLPISTGVSGLGTGAATFLATPTSANLAAMLTDETGTGANVFATSPTLVTPVLGTPTSVTLTNATGLPVSTGISGLGTGAATFLATPTSANLAAMLTDETGTGANVFASSPSLSAPTLAGIVTTDGANITTASAMGALAVDVTKGLNTKSVSVDSTFTFSGTPATANTWFSVHVTNTDTNPHILTYPSAFSLVTQAARTTCPVPASGQLWLMFRYDGSAYHVFGDGPFLNNFAATADPAVTDDVADGYGPGSLWGNATANTLFWCESNSAGAAVWNSIGGAGSGDMILASVQTVTGAKTFNSTKLIAAGSTSGTTTINAAAVAGSTTTTLPNANSTLPIFGQQITFTGPTAARSIALPDAAFTVARSDAAQTFTGTQTFGAVVGTTWNGNTWATGTGTLSIAAGKTLTSSNTLTLAGTDATTMTFPGVSSNIGYLESPINSQSAAYTLVIADSAKTIYHPSADTTARIWTIPANSSVAFPVGTIIAFDNDISAGTLTISITTDTLVLVGAAGSTGSRTLAAGGRAVAQKVTSTRWRISGTAELT
jgi:hypothetical protein